MHTIVGLFTGITLVLIAISIHEFAHAWSANTMGDSTARYRGRVTLDPIAHLDPIGTILILISSIAGVGFGWGRPVPVTPGNFKNPPLGLAIVSAAGPLSNVVQAVVAAVLLQAVRFAFPAFPEGVVIASQILVIAAGLAALAGAGGMLYQWYTVRRSPGLSAVGDFSWKVVGPKGTPWWQNEDLLKQMVRGGLAGVLLFGFLANPIQTLTGMILVNIVLALFNLIPLGPLDGNGILRGLLLNSTARWTYDVLKFLDRIQPFGSFILLGLFMLDNIIPILSLYLMGGARLIGGLLGV